MGSCQELSEFQHSTVTRCHLSHKSSRRYKAHCHWTLEQWIFSGVTSSTDHLMDKSGFGSSQENLCWYIVSIVVWWRGDYAVGGCLSSVGLSLLVPVKGTLEYFSILKYINVHTPKLI